jgi:hypothetical protein
VDFFLQINAHRLVGSDYLVGADARVGGDVSAGIWNSHIGGYVAHRVMRTLDGGRNQAAQEFLTKVRSVVRL